MEEEAVAADIVAGPTLLSSTSKLDQSSQRQASCDKRLLSTRTSRGSSGGQALRSDNKNVSS